MKFQPIEETLIVPPEYSEFSKIFPSIYRKISERLNDKSFLEQIVAYIGTNNKTIYSHLTNDVQSLLYIIFGNADKQPATVGICIVFADKTGLLLPLANHSPSGDTLSVQLNSGDLQVSLSAGEGLFEIKLLFL